VFNDMGTACAKPQCRVDSGTGKRVGVVWRDIQASNREYLSTVEKGISDLYDTSVPSGMLIRNGAVSTSGELYDILLDVDYSKIPSGMQPWEYYQFASWENAGAIYDDALVLDLAVVGSSTQDGATFLDASVPIVVGGSNTLYGQTGNAPGGEPYRVAFVVRFFVAGSGTTTPVVMKAVDFSIADLDAMTFPGCDGGGFLHHMYQLTSCTICGSTATLKAGGSVEMADCTANWVDGSAHGSHGLWGQECVHVNRYARGMVGIHYVLKDGASADAAVPAAKSLTVDTPTSSVVRICGAEPGFAGDNSYDIGALSSSTSSTGSWSGGSNGNWWTTGRVTFNGIDQQARTVTLAYEYTNAIEFELSTQPHRDTWVTGRRFVLGGATNLQRCAPPPTRATCPGGSTRSARTTSSRTRSTTTRARADGEEARATK
jgi:hypothetical protein